jgi:PAS domain S-box-containing protein
MLLDTAMAVMAACLAFLFWKRGTRQFRSNFITLSLLVLILAVTYMCERLVDGLSAKLLCNDVEYISIAGIPVLYLVIVVRYAGREDLLTRRNLAIACAVPAFVVLMVWTNSYLHLFYQEVHLDPVSGQIFTVKGPVYYIHIIYSLILEMAAISVAVIAFIRCPKLQRAQVGLILISAVIPTAVIMLSLGRLISVPIVDAMISAFIFSGVTLYLAVYRYGLFYATPLVLNSIADIMQDGAVMIDQEGRVTYLNSAAERFVHNDGRFPLGRMIAEVMPEVHASLGPEREGLWVVETAASDGSPLRLEVMNSAVNVEDKRLGRLLILRDITSVRRTEEALASSNSKLNVLYGITRHDILNRITVIRGYGQLLKEKAQDPSQSSEYLKRMMEATAAIEHLINFTRDYEKIGVLSPEWQNVERTFQRAKVLCAEQGVEYAVTTGSLEVYADPMLERLFYILLDNTNRHGAKVSKVRLTVDLAGDACSIVYEDDGMGVGAGEKEKIFIKGYGRDSGLGLYLGMQILGITGMGIKENGTPGGGARFEIIVPKGKWRMKQTIG